MTSNASNECSMDVNDSNDSELQIDVENDVEMKSETNIDSNADITGGDANQSSVQKTGKDGVDTDLENGGQNDIESDVKTADTNGIGSDVEKAGKDGIEANVDDSRPKEEMKSKVESKAESKADSKYVRKTSTDMVSKIWLSIESIDWQKSRKELSEELTKKMLNLFNIKFSETKINELLDRIIADKLIVTEESADKQMRFVANFDRKLLGELTNDWLCFECHSVRETESLFDCNACFRAFHYNCLKSIEGLKDAKRVDEKCFECIYCRRLQAKDESLKVNTQPKQALNQCIALLLHNLEFSYDSQMFDKYSIDCSQKSKVFVFKEMDLKAIKQKAANGQYDCLQELVNDFKHFLHNYMVCVESDPKQALDEISDFENRFEHEVSELKLCVDCYKYSSDIQYDNEEPDKPHHWFTLVCEPLHELCFAKLGKYPFWPAKVIAIKPGGKAYDVRFFDPPDFSRAVIPIERLRPIEGFRLETEDEDMDLPVQLLEEHIKKIKAKGLRFVPTIKERAPKGPPKERGSTGSAKGRDSKGSAKGRDSKGSANERTSMGSAKAQEPKGSAKAQEPKGSAKKRTNTEMNKSDRPLKRQKKSIDSEVN